MRFARWKAGLLAAALLFILGPLAGCAGGPTPAPTRLPTAAPTAIGLPTRAPATEYVPYVNDEGNFTMNLPAAWTIGEPQTTPLGSVVNLGPDPKAGGPANSTIVVSDAQAFTINQVIGRLCGGGCATLPKLENVTLNGIDAWRASFAAKDAPELVWHFVEFEGKVVSFSIHDPKTLKPLDEVIESISFGSARDLDPATVPATAAILSYAAKQAKIEISKIRVLGLTKADWPNGCLGLPAEGEQCTEALVSGYGGMLDAGGQLFEFRSDKEGKRVRLLPAGVLAAQQILAQQLHLDINAVRIIRYAAQQWPDACMGITLAGQTCAKVVTPGYITTVEAEGQRYVFHADQNGQNVQLATAPKAEMSDAGVIWKQTAGVCQIAQINQSKVVFGPCEGPLMAGKYAFENRAKSYVDFIGTYAPFESKTPAGEISFKGQGKKQATAPEQRMIAEWAQLVYFEALGGRSGAAYGLIIAWHREGGFAGFCDDLAVYLTGDVYASSCKGAQVKDLGSSRLTPEQLTQIFTWADALKSFEAEHTDAAKADAMTTSLYFGGAGLRDATDNDKQAIANLAAELYTALSTR